MVFAAKMAQILIIFNVFLALLLHPFSPLFWDRFFSPPLSSACLFGAARKKAHMLKVLALPILFHVFQVLFSAAAGMQTPQKNKKSKKKRIRISIKFVVFLTFFWSARLCFRSWPPESKKLQNYPNMMPNSSQKAPQRPPEDRKIRLKSLQVFPSKSGFNFGPFWLQNGSQTGAENQSKIDLAAGSIKNGLREASGEQFWLQQMKILVFLHEKHHF